jgi:hypothetical protein
VTVPVGRSGRVRVRSGAGSVQLSAAVVGWYGPGATSTFTAVEPRRLLDTRRGLGAATGAVAAGRSVDLRISGARAGTSAVVLSVTALGATDPTDLRVSGGGGPRGTVAPVIGLHARDRAPVVASVVVRPGPDGTVRLRNAAGRVHLVADLVGVYSSAASGSLFRTTTARRVLDTRLRLGTSPGTPALLGPGRSTLLSGGGGTGVPRTATAAVLTVTARGATTRTDVRVFPYGLPAPRLVSQLSVPPRTTVTESFPVRLGAGSAVLRNSAGSVALTVTASGWFGPPT